jgi:hypothetical protein
MNTTINENNGIIFETETIEQFKNALEILSKFKNGVNYNIPNYLWEIAELDNAKYLFAKNDGTVGYISREYLDREDEDFIKAGWMVIGLRD